MHFWLLLQSSFFVHFMCFEVSTVSPPDAPSVDRTASSGNGTNEENLSKMDALGNDVKPSNLLCFVLKMDLSIVS